MTRKQKIYGAVMLLSAVGFLVDRAIRSAPAPAAAEQPVAPDPAGPARQTKVTAQNAAPALVEDPSLAYLEKMSNAWSGRDIFTPTTNMLLHYRQITEAQQNAEQGPAPDPAGEFAAAHRLEATFIAPEGAMAMVSGQLVHVGDSIAGFRVVRIEPRQVELRRGNDRAVLTISTPME
jgi:hypothetical protein